MWRGKVEEFQSFAGIGRVSVTTYAAALKIHRQRWRAGSSPATGTKNGIPEGDAVFCCDGRTRTGGSISDTQEHKRSEIRVIDGFS